MAAFAGFEANEVATKAAASAVIGLVWTNEEMDPHKGFRDAARCERTSVGFMRGFFRFVLSGY